MSALYVEESELLCNLMVRILLFFGFCSYGSYGLYLLFVGTVIILMLLPSRVAV